MQGLTDGEDFLDLVFMSSSTVFCDGIRSGSQLESLLQISYTGFLYLVCSKPTRVGTQEPVEV